MDDLQLYFESNTGRLIHKWTHYFEIYDRHFSRFRNTDVLIVEIGVYHGGSLQMWKNYFGSNAKIIGIDIDPRCKQLEEEGVEILIGNQEDRDFLATLRSRLPHIDILIDDGGHTMRQQIITFEELFPYISENGIYLCEDLHTSYWGEYGGGFRNPNSFIEYSKGLVDYLNAWYTQDPENFGATDFTRSVYSMHYYDSVLVIEKRPMSLPKVQMTGYPAFSNEEMVQSKQVQPPQLFQHDGYLTLAPLQSPVEELKSKYFELVDTHKLIQDHAQNLEATLKESQIQLQQTQVELERSKLLLQQKQSKIRQLRFQLKQIKTQLEESRDEILTMRTSKCWWLRTQWFKLKKILGFQKLVNR
ncbi:MAG: class I SAM-dependent methyltransferase [Cyanobacteria bacterium CRU_2_1]|nr:class I SAM-dependent methyltransferase [Cyanobacteria bacterium RU_5_0]NJR59198.1 class I SAM-dependent methyltransferase [Cyanobacteria bacterium CRU_2_1]